MWLDWGIYGRKTAGHIAACKEILNLPKIEKAKPLILLNHNPDAKEALADYELGPDALRTYTWWTIPGAL